MKKFDYAVKLPVHHTFISDSGDYVPMFTTTEYDYAVYMPQLNELVYREISGTVSKRYFTDRPLLAPCGLGEFLKECATTGKVLGKRETCEVIFDSGKHSITLLDIFLFSEDAYVEYFNGDAEAVLLDDSTAHNLLQPVPATTMKRVIK